MSDNKYDLNVINDDRDFHSQDMEIEDQEGEALLNQEEEQLVDSMELLVCREGDIFANSLLSDSQLVVVVKNPTQDPVVCPAWDAETERALQPDNNFSSVDDVEQRDAYLHEQSCEEHQGPGAQDLLHSPVETPGQDVSKDGVNMSSNHYEPENIHDIVLET